MTFTSVKSSVNQYDEPLFELTAVVGGSSFNEFPPVISQINTPPGGPSVGDRYLIDTTPTGAWLANANNIAEWNGASWDFTAPITSYFVYVTSILVTYRFNGTLWILSPGVAILQNGNSFGSSGVRIGSNDANQLWLKTNNTLRVRIDGSTGDVRIAGNLQAGYLPTAPTARFQTRGTGNTSATYNAKFEDIGGNPLLYIRDDGSIGVGTIAPLAKLHVFDSTQGFIVGNSTGTVLTDTAAFGLGSTYAVFGFKNATDANSSANKLWSLREDMGAGVIQIWKSGVVLAEINGKSGALSNRMFLKNDAGSAVFIVNSLTGQINTPLMQTGDAGLISGDQYKDTAANILANGDYVIGMKA